LLIAILDLLNKLLAIGIVISSTISGYYENPAYLSLVYEGPGARIIMTGLGFLFGVAFAALVSGALATIITIAREAIAIHQLLHARITTVVAPSQVR